MEKNSNRADSKNPVEKQPETAKAEKLKRKPLPNKNRAQDRDPQRIRLNEPCYQTR